MSMNIVVCVKQVPDTAVERTLKPGAGTLDRESPDGLINELDEYAIEEGLKIAEAHGGEVTILSMGPAKASESIRKALSMGADKAVHVSDEALAGSDALVTSLVLAEALKQTGFDLVILGSESTDAQDGGGAGDAGRAAGRAAADFGVEGGHRRQSVTVRRVTDDGYQVVTGPLPAVVSVVEKINEPGIRRSRGSWPRRRSRCRPWPWLTWASTPARRGWPGRDDGGGLRRQTAARGRAGREGRGGRRHEGGRVPRRAEVHLRRAGSWLRYWFSRSTPLTARSRRSPSSC